MKNLSLKVSLALSLWLACCFAQSQIVSPQSQPLRSGEQSALDAARKAKAILAAIGVDAGDIDKMKLCLVDFTGPARWWDCETEDRSFSVMLNPETLRLLSLRNLMRTDEQFRFKNRTGKVFYRDENEAKTRAITLAGKLGMPPGIWVSKLHVVRDGESNDSNKSGYVVAELKNTKGKLVGAIQLDIQDGTLIHFNTRP